MEPDSIIIVSPFDLQCAESILRQPSRPVDDHDWRLLPEIVARLLRVFYSIEHADGISAVQIGIPMRIAIVNLQRIRGQELVLVNPQLVSCSGRIVTRREGCLSLPDYAGPISRRSKITVQAFDVHGVEYIREFKGYEAAVVQHEMDHMNGVLYWDKMLAGARPELRPERKASAPKPD